MPCADPRRQWFVDGKWVTREPLSAQLYRSQEYGCGQCAPCRSSAAGEWTTRLFQEGQMHEYSICCTLTYSPACLPPLGSLVRKHAQDFIRALRKAVAARGGPLLSFDITGEYSPAPVMRPHYHCALFGYVPIDAKPWAKSGSGNDEFVSDELSKAWGKGLVTFQPWSIGAAKYCAGHQAWKTTGDKGRALRVVRDASGQVIGERLPEFHGCSTRPGIGRRFFEAYGEQALRLGFTVVGSGKGSKKVPVPGYYLRRGDVDLPEVTEAAREARKAQAVKVRAKLAAEGLDNRLDSIEYCAQARIDREARKSGF